MKNYFYALLIFSLVGVAYGQSYSPGLPLPGLPKSLGQKVMSGSTSVTIASDQGAIPISGSITASNPSVGTNFVTAPTSSTLVGYYDSSGKLQPFTGNSTGITVSANQGTNPWVTSRNWILSGTSDSVAVTGTVASTQGTSPWVTSRTWFLSGASDAVGVTGTVTSNQGTNPWVTSRNWILSGTSDSVAVTGTVTATPVTVATSTISRATNNTSNATLLSSNASRKSVFLFNDSTSTNCYVKFGTTASLTSFTIKMFATDTYIMDPPVYTGQIDYICDLASGNMEVNEQ